MQKKESPLKKLSPLSKSTIKPVKIGEFVPFHKRVKVKQKLELDTVKRLFSSKHVHWIQTLNEY
jgi:hypothetical protein